MYAYMSIELDTRYLFYFFHTIHNSAFYHICVSLSGNWPVKEIASCVSGLLNKRKPLTLELAKLFHRELSIPAQVL